MLKKNIISFLILNSYLLCQTLFFSEYAEGSSNNKYLEIYNPTNSAIDLTNYAYPSTANAPETPGLYEYWNEFEVGATISAGDVYVICHPSLDGSVSLECDENHTYLSNGDDGYCLVIGSESNYSFVDCIGDWNADPGNGWDVAGVSEATKDHTLVRKIDVNQGNSGEWNSSAGTNSENSEWIVLERDDWSYLGSHPHDIVGGGTDGGTDGGNDSEICNDGLDNDGDGFIDCDDFDCGFNDGCGGEICDDEVDNDDDTYVDCNDFDCSNDPACDNGSAGSCAEYGCVGYTPSNACQCNDLCAEFGNCCDDYEELCASGSDGGSDGGSDSEICDDGIDNDGDGWVDCEDYNCDGTIGDADPACGGSSTGGGSNSEICNDGIDNDGDGFVDCDDFDCGVNDGCDGEICNDGIDNDEDSYIDCNDFDCSNDPACDNGGTGSCAEYGCVGYTPANACQCNDQCADFGNCCDDYEELCAGGDSGGSTSGGGTGGSEPVDADLIFFSEYAEGSSNNKYLEIYNADNIAVDLGLYSISTCANGCNDGSSWDYPNNVEFSIGTNLNPGEVYVVCNGSADGTITGECDQYFTYLSNGDDVMGLTQLSTGGTIDIIGEIGDDPGNGWDVAGVNDATKDHTLVRKSNISSGNSDWALSAGTNADNSEWIVYEQNTWDYLGYHDSGPVSGCLDESAYNYNPDAEIEDNSSCIYLSNVTIQEIQGQADSSPYENLPIETQGVVTAVNSNGFYMQNGGGAWSGIWVYNNGSDLSVEVGQLVSVVGNVLEFYGLTEIEADTVETLSSDSQVEITVVSTNDLNDESYESVIVQVLDAVCTALPNQYDDWIINDGTGDLLVGDDFISYNPDLNLTYNIIGVIDYEFSEFKIQATNVQIAYEEGAPIAQAGDDQFVDEGALVTLDAGASYDDEGSIFSYEWIQTSGVAVDLGDYESQIVQFTAPNQFTVLEFSLVVMDNEFNFSYPDYVKVTVGSQGIYDVQFTQNIGSTEEDCYPSDFVAQSINITGVVTTVKSFSSYPHFFIQDPNVNEWSGVYVYVGESEPYNIGDELNFTAEVEEYYGVTELKNLTNVELLSQNNTIDPIAISTGDLGLNCGVGEKYEGMLVNFSDVVVESIDAQYNSVYVNDGSGTAKFDDYFFNFDAGFWPDLNVGDSIESVSGVVHYYFGEYVIYPRDLNDMSAGGGAGTGGGSGDEICDDGIDNDGDSYIDCEDYNCNGTIGEIDPVCEGTDDGGSTGGGSDDEICDDGIDNDGDSYIDCEDYNCNGTIGDIDPACEGTDDGGSTGGGTTDCDESNLGNLFFSEYAEGSSNNKYLEIYNNSEESIDLCGYAFPNSNNGADVDGSYDFWNTFDAGAVIGAGDVYVICHPSSDETILAECNQTHTYLSNGDDGFCLVYGDENDFEQLDCIGDWGEADPGDGWDVAGVTAGTKDHTLLRKSSVSYGNDGDWASSAGTNPDDSEWIVLEQNVWTNLGYHDFDGGGGTDGGGDDCSVGDINQDNTVNVVDIVQAVNYVLGMISFNEDQMCASDLNGDGIVNVIDIVQLVNVILGVGL